MPIINKQLGGRFASGAMFRATINGQDATGQFIAAFEAIADSWHWMILDDDSEKIELPGYTITIKKKRHGAPLLTTFPSLDDGVSTPENVKRGC